MADKKITALTDLSTGVAGADLLTALLLVRLRLSYMTLMLETPSWP